MEATLRLVQLSYTNRLRKWIYIVRPQVCCSFFYYPLAHLKNCKMPEVIGHVLLVLGPPGDQSKKQQSWYLSCRHSRCTRTDCEGGFSASCAHISITDSETVLLFNFLMVGAFIFAVK
jgi:hypothetical protein